MRSRLRREDGALSAEFAAAVVPLTVVLAFGWQLLLFVAAGNSAAHAARNGSRAAGIGETCATAAGDALPRWLRAGASADCAGERVTVRVDVPILFPGMGWAFDLERSAELPRTARGMP
ncbi:pilus assembly protein [Egicoccus sp. AB-alg2]|uniref:pilus assembly protein n=1 Tax=Egicoccus sp. AB-alg2 TaxID=3242693 RepID=UPI00359D9ADC